MLKFGKMLDVVNKLNFVNKVILSGNKEVVEKYEGELNDMLADLGVFAPKKQALLAYLHSENKKDDARFQALEDERKASAERFEEVIKKDLVESINEMIGENKRLFLARRKKKSGDKWIDMSYLPMGTELFNNPFGKGSCTSVCGVGVTEDIDDVTGQKLIKLSFLSICYDSIDKKYKDHLWNLTYTVEDKKVTEEMEIEANTELNNIEAMF